jgi:hypothetical protein
MKEAIIIASVMAVLAAMPAGAASISDTYVIPAAAHATGAGGELWQSDVQLFNPNATALSVDSVFVNANGTSSTLGATVTIPPNATMSISDVVGSGGGEGAIILSGSQPFIVTSRAYATTTRGTFGESVVPAAEFIDGTTPDAFLVGLRSNAAARTNVGFFAAADRSEPMTVTITVLDANGANAGSRIFVVPAGTMAAVQVSLKSIAASTLDTATARVSITGGRGIATAYASVVDNATSDSTFVAGSSGVLAPSSAAAQLRTRMR